MLLPILLQICVAQSERQNHWKCDKFNFLDTLRVGNLG